MINPFRTSFNFCAGRMERLGRELAQFSQPQTCLGVADTLCPQFLQTRHRFPHRGLRTFWFFLVKTMQPARCKDHDLPVAHRIEPRPDFGATGHSSRELRVAFNHPQLQFWLLTSAPQAGSVPRAIHQRAAVRPLAAHNGTGDADKFGLEHVVRDLN